MKRFSTRLFLIALAALAVCGAVYQGWLDLPVRLLPPAKLDREPGILAHLQLNSLAANGQACRAALSRAGLKFSVMADRKIGRDCGFTDVVRSDATPISFNIQPVATCGMTAALVWYQQRLDAIAAARLNTRILKIDQLGTYACRNINAAVEGRRSQHATANAIDIAAFRLADGRVISVLKDYGKDTPEGKFLDDAHAAACGLFNIVLGPRYNRLHANHFHLDMGGFRFCR